MCNRFVVRLVPSALPKKPCEPQLGLIVLWMQFVLFLSSFASGWILEAEPADGEAVLERGTFFVFLGSALLDSAVLGIESES